MTSHNKTLIGDLYNNSNFEKFQIKHGVMLFKVEEQENGHQLFHWQLNTDKETRSFGRVVALWIRYNNIAFISCMLFWPNHNTDRYELKNRSSSVGKSCKS